MQVLYFTVLVSLRPKAVFPLMTILKASCGTRPRVTFCVLLRPFSVFTFLPFRLMVTDTSRSPTGLAMLRMSLRVPQSRLAGALKTSTTLGGGGAGVGVGVGA